MILSQRSGYMIRQWFCTIVKLGTTMLWIKKTNQVFELPVTAVMKNDIKLRKENDAPVLYYPQHGKGTCGVSSLSSAFYFMFDKNLAEKIHSNKQGCIECLRSQE